MASKINLTDKQGLEIIFAEDFGSPYFPVLADLYLQEGDYRRAKLVCEVGLEHDESNNLGLFILAKVALAEEKLKVAEKWLKLTVENSPANFNALRLLIRLEFDLKRSHKTIQKYIQRILYFLPDDKECQDWLNDMTSAIPKEIPSVKDDDITELENVEIENVEAIPELRLSKEKKYDLKESMATFTMIQVLKNQKHYQQALAVLNMLESKNMDASRISRERSEINSLMAQERNT